MLLSLPILDGVEYDADLRNELGSGLSRAIPYKIILYIDYTIWYYLMFEKDMNPIYLRWYVLLKEFNFEVHDKG